MIFIVLIIIITVLAFIFLGQQIQYQQTLHVSIAQEVQERNRISYLLELDLLKWIKTKPQLSVSWLAFEKDASNLGLLSYELFMLWIRPELWRHKAEEWLLNNTKLDLLGTIVIINMVRLSFTKQILKEHIGIHEFEKIEMVILNDTNPFRGTGKLPFTGPITPIEKWCEKIQNLNDDVERLLDLYDRETYMSIYGHSRLKDTADEMEK